MMKTVDFNFDLPPRLVAQNPPERRGDSRLLLLNRLSGGREHRMVKDLPTILSGPLFCGKDGQPPLLVFNNSKVRKARLIAASPRSGAAVEFLLLEERGGGEWKALTRRARRRGGVYLFFDSEGNEINRAEITGRTRMLSIKIRHAA